MSNRVQVAFPKKLLFAIFFIYNKRGIEFSGSSCIMIPEWNNVELVLTGKKEVTI